MTRAARVADRIPASTQFDPSIDRSISLPRAATSPDRTSNGPAGTYRDGTTIIPIISTSRSCIRKNRRSFSQHRVHMGELLHNLDRYLPNLETTMRLALLSSLIDLIFGYPFAYILIRKVRYRELVRTLMVFPLFGPLYLAYGLSYIFLPNGPLSPVLEFLQHSGHQVALSEPSTLFGMMMFTFPFMVMNIGAALSNVDPMLEEAANTLGAAPWQVFLRVLFPLSYGGVLAGFLMCFGWNLGVFVVPVLLGGLEQQRVISLTLYSKGIRSRTSGWLPRWVSC